MESTFDPRRGAWQVGWPGRIAQHDIVYRSPLEDPMQGLLLGNGDLGVNLWTESNQLILALNKCDTWDDRTDGPFTGWDRNLEEKHTSLRHAGRLVVSFQEPVFDLLYQQDCEARLALAEATGRLCSVTPFSQVQVSAYVSAEYGVLVLDLEAEAPDAPLAAAQVRLERWGSRTFAHWYSQVRRRPEMGLEGTEAGICGQRVVLEQALARLHFVVAAELLPRAGPGVAPRVLHRRAAGYELPSAPRQRWRLYLTIVTSENAPDPRAEAMRRLDRAIAAGEAVRAEHLVAWRRFWEASYLNLSPKNPAGERNYLENIWHLVQYWANSSSRGAYPPYFCQGLWAWNRDYVPWNYYFHWNMQWYVWPLHPANHADLAMPYVRYRRQQLDKACADARERLHRPGAFYADVSDRNGYNDTHLDDNHTPGPQIALDLYRHYGYTGDEAFLREWAWPVMREVARNLISYLTLEHDGLYHALGSAYEGTQPFRDVVTDLAMLRALLPAAITVGQRLGHAGAELAHWQEILDHLPPFHLEPLNEREAERQGEQLILRGGLGAGGPVPSALVPAVGQRPQDGQWVRNRFAGYNTDYYGIPDAEMAPVFPAGIVGLSDTTSTLFKAEVTHLLSHTPAVPDAALAAQANRYTVGEVCMGWCPYPIALARLGLSAALAAELAHLVSTWQIYPQGTSHWGPCHICQAEADQRWRTNQVRDADAPPERRKETFPLPTWPFRYFTNETVPIVATAINEMLLQSHEGVLRLCPALPADWPVRYTLLAQGGFLVALEQAGAVPDWVWIRSTRGGLCRLVNPWPGQATLYQVELDGEGQVLTSGVAQAEAVGQQSILAWETRAGHAYLLSARPLDLDAWRVVTDDPQPNQDVKRLGSAQLGLPRMF